ncbi:hypothetical protein J7E70_17255 [Variovorax paradoxus]|nr:hypothetical protein [Variovorax paradoxus]MBT2302210.1 hypothetical protein [Variovorax paradoxus]
MNVELPAAVVVPAFVAIFVAVDIRDSDSVEVGKWLQEVDKLRCRDAFGLDCVPMLEQDGPSAPLAALLHRSRVTKACRSWKGDVCATALAKQVRRRERRSILRGSRSRRTGIQIAGHHLEALIAMIHGRTSWEFSFDSGRYRRVGSAGMPANRGSLLR